MTKILLTAVASAAISLSATPLTAGSLDFPGQVTPLFYAGLAAGPMAPAAVIDIVQMEWSSVDSMPTGSIDEHRDKASQQDR